jgi:hypothetical protein
MFRKWPLEGFAIRGSAWRRNTIASVAACHGRRRREMRWHRGFLIGHLGSARTHYQIVNQLRKMCGALFIAQKKVVEFGGALGPDQPILDQRGLKAGKDCGHALSACGSRFIIRQHSPMRNWVDERSRHGHGHRLLGTTNAKIVAEPPLRLSNSGQVCAQKSGPTRKPFLPPPSPGSRRLLRPLRHLEPPLSHR